MTKAPRNRDAIEKVKESIVEAAVEIINSDGFQRMTMRKIASKMGMSATNLYNYFANKDEIYINILIRGFKLLYGELKSVYDAHRDPVERGKKFIAAYLSFGLRNFNYYDIMFSPVLPKYNDYIGSPLEVLAQVEMDYSRKIIELSVQTVSEVLTSARKVEAGEVERRMIEVWSMLHGMISLYHGRMVDYVTAKPAVNYEAIVDDILDYIMN